MPSQKNVHGLAEIKHHLETAKAVILANYAGLSVADQTTLRAKLSAAGGEFMVAKNNLVAKNRNISHPIKAQNAPNISFQLNPKSIKFLHLDPYYTLRCNNFPLGI